jgi:GGDEF domain-containing protein
VAEQRALSAPTNCFTRMSEFSQRTLGILRDILTGMEPKKATSTYMINELWQKALFDFGLQNHVIRMMQSHNFNWVNIIPNLHGGTLGYNFSFSDDGLSLGEHDEVLHSLIFFALEKSGSVRIPELMKALEADGFKLAASPAVDLNVPKELSELPNADVMRADVSERLKSGGLVALLFVDLDNFKSVNDQLGSHAEGDKCLVRAVKAMSAAIIHKGKLYRRSGDEFIVILPNSIRAKQRLWLNESELQSTKQNPAAQ